MKTELHSYGGVFGDHYTVRAFDQLMEKYASIHTDHVQFLVRKDRGVSRLMSAARVDDDAAANLGKGEALWLRVPVNEAIGGEIQAAYDTLGESEKNVFELVAEADAGLRALLPRHAIVNEQTQGQVRHALREIRKGVGNEDAKLDWPDIRAMMRKPLNNTDAGLVVNGIMNMLRDDG